jgi:hypothetical protein
MTDTIDRQLNSNGHMPAPAAAFVNIDGPENIDGPVNADDINAMYREYTHMFIDELFDCLGLEDVGFGKKSGLIAFFDGAITTGTFQERLIAMIRRWGDFVAAPMVEGCGSATEGCQFRRCLVHNLPDLCINFKVDPELQRIFDELNRRGVWRYLGMDGNSSVWSRYLNTLTGEIVYRRPADYRDIDENDLVTREGGL